MGNVWIHVNRMKRAVRMQFAEFLNIVLFACVPMDSEVNQRKVVHDRNALLTATVKLINDAKLAHAGIHVCKPAPVV